MDIMTMEDFKSAVKCGALIDYDGWGYYAVGDCETKIMVKPSDVSNGRLLEFYPNIIWYNR